MYCSNCGKEIEEGRKFCRYCGANVEKSETTNFSATRGTGDIEAENTSGQGSLAQIPKEIKGWNWGAFVLGWLWGSYNLTELKEKLTGKARGFASLRSKRLWLSLLTIIPYAGLIMCIVLGVKGNKWAWQNKKWDSIEHFKRTQRKWAWWGLGVWLVTGPFWFLIGMLSAS